MKIGENKMSEIKILNQNSTEQNEFYNAEKSNNGGGYSQPCKVTVFEYEGEEYKFIYNSTSCGDFGSRFTKTLYKNNIIIAELEVDNVSNDNIWKSSFYWNNPLHIAMYNVGLLKEWNFNDDNEDE